ncbi:hypothetical protein AX774_g2190 [Zancudomyces culisetae]|uniref:Uncharacterized protein n=1 Tax=Zancudomyces culisetae TaxID=1213189 RepID=A0A1R1PTM0_ZANCU|nr:hypothetical protein AX774_g2489 [Zancudomyces culisetae]OMH84297.1 hypothetical protein AX774_g2190 [Zancudomyces culisetae]|eukprot:OMH83995.1 hypothetical protein AX774_g2489 [Zancudomyces culisetae]
MRLAFISSGILYYGLSAVLQQSINEENDLRPFEYENPDPNQPPIVTTYRDYDVGEANKQRIHTIQPAIGSPNYND